MYGLYTDFDEIIFCCGIMETVEKKDLASFNDDILNTLQESLLVLDSGLRVVYANRSFYSTFKVDTHTTEGVLVYELGNGQWNIPKLRDLLEKILPTTSVIEKFEVEHDFPVVGHKTMRINARRVEDAKGDFSLILMAIEDITEEKRLMEFTTRANKLSAVGLLSAGIAHGLNSPLTGILNFLKVYSNHEEQGSEKFKELKLMLEAASFMSQTIQNLTQFAGDIKGAVSPIDIIEVANSTLLFTERQLVVNNIEIVRDFPEHVRTIMGNKSQLQHALLNLILNSKDAINSNGRITIRLRDSTVDNSVIIEVEDTGYGIPAENLPMMFTPFFTTKGDNGGVGLGLSAVKGIIDNHNGTIRVESEEGKGAKFIINIPATV